MSASQHEHLRAHYAPRAAAYLASPTHATGEDLDQIEALVARLRPARVLDLGCGGGHVTYRAAPHAGSVTACDLTAEMLALVNRTAQQMDLSNVRTMQAAAECLPFEDAAFDLVLCRFSAHHWSDLDAGLREARRVTAAGGQALVVDSIAPPAALLDTHLQTLELLRDASHVRNYPASEWLAAMGRAGWCVTGLTQRRLPMEFGPWVARTQTTQARIEALREVQAAAAPEVARHFAIQPDGSWMLDTLTIGAMAG